MSDLPCQLGKSVVAGGSSLIPRELNGAQEGARTLVIMTCTLLDQSDFALVVFHRSKQIEAIPGSKNKEFGTSLAPVLGNAESTWIGRKALQSVQKRVEAGIARENVAILRPFGVALQDELLSRESAVAFSSGAFNGRFAPWNSLVAGYSSWP
jgi:hypothetical protein